MKNAVCIILLVVAVLLGSSGGVRADDDRGITCSIESQERSIGQRAAWGKLTRREADLLQDNIEWIKLRYARMKQDGQITRPEMEAIDRLLDQNAEMIFKGARAENIFSGAFQERINAQQHSINQGIASGQLTRKEAKAMQDRLEHVRSEFERMKRDRVLTVKELERLDFMLDRNEQVIRRQKLDPQTAFNERRQTIEKRIRDQQRRIDEAVASGQLNRREAHVVQDNLEWVRVKYERMKQDGRLSAGELEVLDEMLDGNDEMIFRRRGAFENVYIGPFRHRIEDQQRLINENASSGRLDRREARIVQGNLDRIRADFDRFVSDRALTAAEADKLDRLLDRNELMILKKSQPTSLEQVLEKTLDRLFKDR